MLVTRVGQNMTAPARTADGAGRMPAMAAEAPGHDWLDDDAGPVVRPYAVTGGRVRPTRRVRPGGVRGRAVAPTPPRVASACSRSTARSSRSPQDPLSVAEVASDLDLPSASSGCCSVTCSADGLISLHEPPRRGISCPTTTSSRR